MSFKNTRGLAAAGLCLALLLLGPSVSAEPGDGLRSENGWGLVPSLTLGTSYNSNVFRTAPAEDSPVVGSFTGHLQPKVAVTNPDDRNFRFTFDASAKWDEYFGGQRREDGKVTSIDNQSGLSANGNVSATLNPRGDLSLKLDENISRHNEPPTGDTGLPYNWWVNRAGATVGIHPGAGVLTTDLGYQWSWFNYTTDVLDDLDRHEHRFDLDARWNFLPKTSLLANVDYTLTRWEESLRTPGRTGTGLELVNSDSDPLRLKGGLTGLLTNRIAVRALAGYGWSMHNVGPSFDGLVGEGALSFTFGPTALENTFEVGYRRDFGDATVGNFFTMHEMFATYEQTLIERMVALYGGVFFQLRDYSLDLELEDDPDSANDNLNDELLMGRLGVRTDVTDWITFDLNYNIRANFTDDRFDVEAVDPADPTIAVLREYTQHRVILSTTLRY